MLYSVVILAIALPILTIGAFILGWNLNAPESKKIAKKRKRSLDDNEKLLQFIDNFQP